MWLLRHRFENVDEEADDVAVISVFGEEAKENFDLLAIVENGSKNVLLLAGESLDQRSTFWLLEELNVWLTGSSCASQIFRFGMSASKTRNPEEENLFCDLLVKRMNRIDGGEESFEEETQAVMRLVFGFVIHSSSFFDEAATPFDESIEILVLAHHLVEGAADDEEIKSGDASERCAWFAESLLRAFDGTGNEFLIEFAVGFANHLDFLTDTLGAVLLLDFAKRLKMKSNDTNEAFDAAVWRLHSH